MLTRNAIALLSMFCVIGAGSWCLPKRQHQHRNRPLSLQSRPVPDPGAAQDDPGHPRTIWDQQDIAHYKQLLKTSPELKSAFDKLQTWADNRITQSLNVPATRWMRTALGPSPPSSEVTRMHRASGFWEWNFNTAMQQRSADVSNLGMLYALTGNEQYAAFATKLLLALADAYGNGQGNPHPTRTDMTTLKPTASMAATPACSSPRHARDTT